MKYLVVVDMQNDFISMALGTSEAEAILPVAVARIQEAKKAGYQVIATMDTHAPDYLDTQEGRRLPVVHCVKGTIGWELNEQIKEAIGDALMIEKPTFGSEILVQTLKAADQIVKIDEIELIGLCTDICVVSNALLLKAAFLEPEIKVNAACCAGVTVSTHQAALETMKMCQITIVE